jgi:hypothetical protein
MKKYIEQMKKTAVAVLLVVMVMSVFTSAQNVVQAAQNWQTAFSELLRSHIDAPYEFALHDFNNDGVPEIIVRVSLHNSVYRIYQYVNGQVTSVFSSNDIHDRILHIENNEMYFLFSSQASDEAYHLEFTGNQFVFTEVTLDFINRLTPTLPQFHAVNPANIAAHIYGVTANANSHPFAVELQNIINNLPTGHTLESATLINLDERGEQRGVFVRIWQDETEGIYIFIYMVGNSIRRHEGEFGLESNFILLGNNMLLDTVVFGDFGRHAVYRLQNGELQSRSISRGFDYDSHVNDFIYEFSDWTNSHFTAISENRYSELAREFGLVGDWWENTLPNQTAQILAMQAAAAPQPTPQINVTLDGVPIPFEVPPQNVDGRTLVPLRAIFEAMGATIDWNGGTQTVTAIRGNDTVVLQVGNHTMTRNGQSITLDVPPRIMEGRTFVPARAVAEAFGAVVGWDNATRTVTIITQ